MVPAVSQRRRPVPEDCVSYRGPEGSQGYNAGGLGFSCFALLAQKSLPFGGRGAYYSGTTDAHSIMTAPHVPYKFMCDIKRRSHACKHSATAISTRNGRKCTDSLGFFEVYRQIPKREAVKVCNCPFLCSVRLKVDSVNALTQD